MTCKNSYFKLVKETLKHHIASVFISCVIFFIQFIVFFLDVQNCSNMTLDSNYNYVAEQIFNITSPNGVYVIPIVIVAIVLAYDFFRYMHSKKQTDFYESLPYKRRDWFVLRAVCSFIVFLIPYFVCTILESILLLVLGFHQIVFFTNLLWNFVCMLLIYLFTWFTAVLAMIMTGHPITAFCGFCVFTGYFPVLLRFIFPAYAQEYFQTFVSDTSKLDYLEYISPIGAAFRLLNSNYSDWTAHGHIIDFIILIILILLVATLTYVLYQRRPSEAAGRAMTFEKINPVIRILLVIPITLYLGLYLNQVASYGKTIWMLFGFLIGTYLLHGIIESIFQFDIRGLWSYKRQMVCCFLASILVSCIFWFDLLHFDEYLPELDELERISINLDRDHYVTSEQDGIKGESLADALLLAQNLVAQGNTISSKNVEGIRFTYHLKDGSIQQRYYYMNFTENQELIDKIYATKEFKDDICQLYSEDWSAITYITWDDTISSIPLYMTETQLSHLFETYIAEYTPMTYSQARSQSSIGSFRLKFGDDKYGPDYPCYVYEDFTQTIELLNDFIQADSQINDYGEISESVLDKYEIRQIELYVEEQMITITDAEKIAAFKEHLVLNNEFYAKNPTYNWEEYYDSGISLNTKTGIQYTSAIIKREIADKLINDLDL